MIKIYVIGINFDNPAFEMIFDLLDEGASLGIEYRRIPWLTVTKEEDIMDGDAYIFLEMKPVERLCINKLTMYISHNDTSSDIDSKLSIFVEKIQEEPSIMLQDDPEDLPPWDCNDELTQDEVISGRIREIVAKIKDQEVRLNPGDIALLVKVDKFLKDNGYVIEEIIV